MRGNGNFVAESASFSKVVKILRTIKSTEDATPEDATTTIYMLCDLGKEVARKIFSDHCGGKESEVARITGGCCLPQSLFRARSQRKPGEAPYRGL
jgi:hypothetical protein